MADNHEDATGGDAELIENNQGVSDTDLMMETLKRKLEVEKNRMEEAKKENEEPAGKKMMLEQKCAECSFKCYTDAEMRTHMGTSHNGNKKVKCCATCSYTCSNIWELDFHCRSRGHTAKKDDGVPCKKCDYVSADKDDAWVHKREHIPADKLVECGDCPWVGDRLDNIRYHAGSTEHKMKEDYEGAALAKAEAKGTKEVAAYKKKLAKDMKRACHGK